MTAPSPHVELAELVETIRAGDTTITAAALAKARDAAALAELWAEADLRRATANTETAQTHAREQVRTDHLRPLDTALDGLRVSYATLVHAHRDFTTRIERYGHTRQQAITAARLVGLAPEAETAPQIDRGTFTKLAYQEADMNPDAAGPVGYPATVRRHPLLTPAEADRWDIHLSELHTAAQQRAAATRAEADIERADRTSPTE